MGIMTKEEYLDSLRKMNPEIFMVGKRLEGPFVDSPYARTNLNVIGLGYDLANDPKWSEDFTSWSTLIDEKVSWWNAIPETTEDVLQLVRNIKNVTSKKYCVFCMGLALDVLWAITYDMDKEIGTKYHHNLQGFFKEIQKDDLRFCMGVMDAKGDRGVKPGKQSDPDVHMRIVEKNDKGIVVRGCKAHVSGGPVTHRIVVIPCRAYGADEEEFVVSFALPTNTPGIKYIVRPSAGPIEKKEMTSPLSSEVGWLECFTVFDDVFVPWENVFMCGEWEYTDPLMRCFSAYVRLTKGVCVSARTDIFIGASALVSQVNGIEKAGHVKSKLTEMMTSSLVGYGCGLAAAVEAKKHPSGVMIPDISLANAGLYEGRMKLQKYFGTLMDLSGGAVTTMPLEEDYNNPETRGYIEKYMKGKTGISSEDRIRALNLSRDLCASYNTGYLMSNILCAGGTPETNKVEIWSNFDWEQPMKTARAMAKIDGSVLDQE